MQRATGKGGFIKPPPLRWIRRASRIGSPAAGYAPGAWSAPADGGSAAGGERKIHFMFVVEYPDQDVRRPLFPVKDHLDVGRHR